MSVREIWEKYGFEIVIGIAFVFLVVVTLFRRGKKGTWGSPYTMAKPKGRRPPQESKGEVECRRVMEAIFRKPFPKARPSLLRNPVTSEQSDNNLELDCYNSDLAIAVEYNGVQHYKYSPYFHKSREAFHNQKYRDYMKKTMCEKNGIILIEVPYTVKVSEIASFLYRKLSSLGYINGT